MVLIREFIAADTDAVVALWEQTGLTRPWNDPYADIERKSHVQPELFLVAAENDVVVGSVMAGYDGHRGWISYLAAAQQGIGVGRALVTEAERRLQAMGCPKVQLMVRTENEKVRGFYEALGYEAFEVVNMGKRLIHDVPDPS